MGAQRRGEGRRPGAGRRGRLGLPLLVALAALLLAAPAQASFHLIKVREVFPGTTAHPSSSYVELQMYASGQYLVQFGELEVLNSAGTITSTFKPGSSVSNFANQSTVLIADTEFSSQFPSVAPDFTDEGLNLNPAGGAVCWPQTDPPFDDCASWGNFAGQGSLPSPGDASPAASSGIPNGMAILRSIEPGCPTLLEDADDTNNSSVDFSVHTPNPRNNAATPTEKECMAPVAIIDERPKPSTNNTAAAFTYHSEPAGAGFECKLDTSLFEACPVSGIEYVGLTEGSHTFQVRAKDVNGTGLAASYTWTVDLTAPTASITSHPANPSPGATVPFTYSSNESNSTFECRLSPTEVSFTSCPKTGKNYSGLADGTYTFAVRAIDPAGNVQPTPTEFSWEVDNSLADKTPPETTIVSKPPDPSSSSTATFTYSSNEPGSSFECSLDGAAFSGCAASGITYTSLGNGPHSFQVRAIDPSNNTDPSPAGYSFDVVIGGTPLPTPSGSGGGSSPPETNLSGKPLTKTHDRTPTFRFRSPAAGATFQCKLDGGPFKACRSPFTTKVLSFGRHTLKIRAVLAGAADPTPTSLRFKVERP